MCTPACRRPVIGLLLGVLLLAGHAGCDRASDEPTGAAPQTGPSPSGVVRLTAEAVAGAGIEVVPVARSAFRLHRDFPATVQPNENELAEVTTLIRGRVVEVYVDVGRDVEKGTPLALLHSTDLGLAEAAYLKSGAKLHEAVLVYERARDLLQHKAISQAEFQRREAEMKTARAEAREARNRLELLGVPEQEIQRLDREQTIRPDVPMRAPFSGRVIMRNLTRGEVVEINQKLFTVADLSDVWVVGNIPEKDVRFIHKDQSVEVRALAYPQEVFAGTITYVGDMLDPATRTMRLRVTVPNPQKKLKPEMFATVRVYAAAKADVLTVPLAAVQTGAMGKMVFVQRAPGEFEARAVTPGEELGDVVAILEGLREGERVVATGAFALKSEVEKQKIEPTR
jgi:cobalt-zinc-cadmium efflux system membrane fusion protein